MVDLITREDMAAFEAEQAGLRQQRELEAQACRPRYEPPAVYSRRQVAELFAARRRGEWSGTDLEWAQLEVELVRAGREGRILGGIDIGDRGENGPPV